METAGCAGGAPTAVTRLRPIAVFVQLQGGIVYWYHCK